MIVESFYVLISEWDPLELNSYNVGDVGDFSVCKRGKLLHNLTDGVDVVLTVMATPTTEVIDDGDPYSLTLNNAVVENRQALSPSLMESIIELDKEDIYANNGILFDWAFRHKFKSTLLHYFDKYPTARRYIDRLIYSYLTTYSYSDLIIFLIDRYNYDVKKDDCKLFSRAAMCKNDYLCRWLIEEKDAVIPSTLYKIYMTYGARFKDMHDLFEEYSNKVELS